MWNDRYNTDAFVYGTEPNDFLLAQFAKIPAGGHVLCLAEGEGRNAVFLAEQGYCVTAVDMSHVGLQKAKRLAESKGLHIETIVVNLSEFDFGVNRYDGIVSIFAHLPSPIRKLVHANVKAALKENGIFILEAYTERQLLTDGVGGPPASAKDMFMSSDILSDELKGMQVNMNVELTRILNEGTYHTGNSEVVQCIATKCF